MCCKSDGDGHVVRGVDTQSSCLCLWAEIRQNKYMCIVFVGSAQLESCFCRDLILLFFCVSIVSVSV